MSFIRYLRDERYKLACAAISTAVGFLFALLANSAVEDWKDRRTYQSLLHATRAEAKFNQAVLEESFLPLFRDGVVLREFSVATATQNLSNATFVKHARPEVLEALGAYVRNLTLANAYRSRMEVIRFNDAYLRNADRGKNPAWEAPLMEKWAENLTAVRINISRVTDLQ